MIQNDRNETSGKILPPGIHPQVNQMPKIFRNVASTSQPPGSPLNRRKIPGSPRNGGNVTNSPRSSRKGTDSPQSTSEQNEADWQLFKQQRRLNKVSNCQQK